MLSLAAAILGVGFGATSMGHQRFEKQVLAVHLAPVRHTRVTPRRSFSVSLPGDASRAPGRF